MHKCELLHQLSWKMELLAEKVTDLAVIRRMLFAVSFLPSDYPQYWQVIAMFACKGSKLSKPLAAHDVRVLMENVQVMNSAAFVQDKQLLQEIITADDAVMSPMGLILISSKSKCCVCGGKLLTRGDRPSRVTLYTESLGTVPGSHYQKYCQNIRRGCKLVQHYGYHTNGDFESGLRYDDNWEDHKYFLSSQETGFELAMLKRFDGELLIGQVSYHQKAEIYNMVHEYGVPKKQCSTLKLPLPDCAEQQLVR